MATEFSGRGGSRSYGELAKKFGRVGGPGFVPFAGASEAAPAKMKFTPRMREKAARALEGKAKPRTYGGVSGPVTTRRVAPTVPKGTRAARLKQRGGFAMNFEEREARTTAERLRNDIFPELTPKEQQGKSPIIHGGDPEVEPKHPKEAAEESRGRTAQIRYERSADAARLRAGLRPTKYGGRNTPSRVLSLAARTGGPWAEKGAGGLEARAKQSAAVSELEKKERAGRKGAARVKAARAKMAQRQLKAGVKTPAVTTEEREARSKAAERAKLDRVMRGKPGIPKGRGLAGVLADPAIIGPVEGFIGRQVFGENYKPSKSGLGMDLLKSAAKKMPITGIKF